MITRTQVHWMRKEKGEIILLSSFHWIHSDFNFYLLTATVTIVLSNTLDNALHLTLLHTKWNVMNKLVHVSEWVRWCPSPVSLSLHLCVCLLMPHYFTAFTRSVWWKWRRASRKKKNQQIKGRGDADKITSRCVLEHWWLFDEWRAGSLVLLSSALMHIHQTERGRGKG